MRTEKEKRETDLLEERARSREGGQIGRRGRGQRGEDGDRYTERERPK